VTLIVALFLSFVVAPNAQADDADTSQAEPAKVESSKEPRSLARFVPADAGLCVEITNLAAHLDRFYESRLFARFQSFPPLAGFLKSNRAAVQALAEELREQTGLSAGEMVHQILGQQVLVAVWPGEAENSSAPGPALALVECDDAVLLARVTGRLLQAERAAGRSVAKSRWQSGLASCDIHRIDVGVSESSLYLAVIDRFGIVATSETLVTKVLDLRAGKQEAPSLADRAEYRAGMERLNPQAVVRAFLDPQSWRALIAAHDDSAGEVAPSSGKWLAEQLASAEYLVLSCEIGERVVAEAFLQRRHRALVKSADTSGNEARSRLAERLPAGAAAAFAGRVDLGRLLEIFFGDRANSGEPEVGSLVLHDQPGLHVLSALIAERGRNAVAALLPDESSSTAGARATKPAWVVGFDTHSLLPADRLVLGERLDPVLRATLTATIMMYNRAGASMSIESVEEDGVPLTSVAGLALMGQGKAATFSLLKGYFWAGTSRDIVRDAAQLAPAQSLAGDARFQELVNPRITGASHLAYFDLAALRRLMVANSDERVRDLYGLASLADRLLVELEISPAGIAISATAVADPAP
jgi:hypothetical protein